MRSTVELSGLKSTRAAIRRATLKKAVKYRYLYLFLIPALVWYAIFNYAPIYGLQIVFRDFKIMQGITGSQWVGLKHFEKMLSDATLLRTLQNTLLISGLKLVFVGTSGLVFALLLNEVASKRYRGLASSVTMLPHFFSWVVIASILTEILSPSSGMVNEIIRRLGGKPIYFLGNENWSLFWVVLSDVWESASWNSIIFIAAIGAISPELYDAAQIDGAGRWAQMLHVTLPCIAATVVVVMILKVGSLMSAGFDQIYNLYNSSTMDRLDIIDTYVFRLGIKSSKYSYSAAVGLFKNVVGVILVLMTNAFSKKIGQSGLF